MKKHIVFLAILLPILFSPLAAQQFVIAVLNFQNNSGNAEMNYLENAIPEMLITNLLSSSKITIVERMKINHILDEQKLVLSGAIDEDMVIKIGKLVGARQLLYGSIFGDKDQLRIDARICDATNGKVIVAEKVDMSDGTDLISRIDALAIKLLSRLTNENISITYPDDIPAFEPTAGKVIAVSCAMDNRYKLNNTTAPAYLLINLNAGKVVQAHERLPLNLCIVLDKSGSMGSENKLENVKKAALFVIENLNKNDYFSLVTYDTHVYTPIPSQLISNKENIKNVIQEIEAGSSTNLSGGLMEGFAQVEQHFKHGYVNREILLTDGLANTGITNPLQLKQIVIEKNRRGCTLSTFGVGYSYNEDMLTMLAEFGGANYYYIDNPEQIAEIFSNELQGLLSIVAQNAVLEIELSPGVRVLDLFGYIYATEGNHVQVKLNDIFSEEARSILVKLDVPQTGNSKLNIGTISLHYDDVVIAHKRITEKFTPAINYTDDITLVQQHKNPLVQENIALFESTRLLDEAISSIDKQDFEGAKKMLDQNMNYLQSNINLNSSKRLKQQMLNVAKYAEENKQVEEMDEVQMKAMQKEVKYKNYLQKKKK